MFAARVGACWVVNSSRRFLGDRHEWSASDRNVPRCSLNGSKRRRRHQRAGDSSSPSAANSTQGLLWATAPYQEEAPAIATPRELAGAMEHLQYAVFRRYHNQLTRAERSRLDNTIDNALFKIERYCAPGSRSRGRAVPR